MTEQENTIKKGMKFNTGKLRYSIIPMEAVREVVKVSEYGAIKYEPNNWKNIKDMNIYYDALMRHIIAWKTGETHDLESGLHHLAHGAWNALTLVWFAIQNGELDPDGEFNLEYLEKWKAEKAKIKAEENSKEDSLDLKVAFMEEATERNVNDFIDLTEVTNQDIIDKYDADHPAKVRDDLTPENMTGKDVADIYAVGKQKGKRILTK